MFGRMFRKLVIASGLVAVASVAAANALGYVDAPHGSVEIEVLETMPVLHGDLGEVVVVGSRHDLPEVVVAAQRPLPAEGVMADITVTAQREAPRIVEFSLLAGVPAGALVQ